jgi:polysaccharide biosynthesis/export protein
MIVIKMTLKYFRGLVNPKNNIKLIVLVLHIILLGSCVTQQKVEYLRDKNDNIKPFIEAEFPDYKLKPFDELFIQISSLDEGAANIFYNTGSQTSSTAGGLQPYSASMISYSIDKEGCLLLPIIGNVFVKDKTISQVSLILRDSLNHVLNQPIVSVKLVNRYITVLGEVRNPGHLPYSQEKLTVFDALALAGNVTDYGNPKKVILVRNENGSNIRINLNLTQSEILTSGYYNLRPNDIVYVKALRNKSWVTLQIPLSLLLSTITTGLLIYSLVR